VSPERLATNLSLGSVRRHSASDGQVGRRDCQPSVPRLRKAPSFNSGGGLCEPSSKFHAGGCASANDSPASGFSLPLS